MGREMENCNIYGNIKKLSLSNSFEKFEFLSFTNSSYFLLYFP